MKARKPVGKRNPEVTEETRKKISTRLKAKWRDPAYRERRKLCMPNRRGIPHTEQTKARISAAVKEKWKNPEYREKVSRGEGAAGRKGGARRKGKKERVRGHGVLVTVVLVRLRGCIGLCFTSAARRRHLRRLDVTRRLS